MGHNFQQFNSGPFGDTATVGDQGQYNVNLPDFDSLLNFGNNRSQDHGQGGFFGDNNIFNQIMGSTTFKNINSGLGMFGDLAKLYGGFKGISEMKKSRQFQEGKFQKNFNAQAQLINNELRDRWRGNSRAASDRGRDFLSESDFMNQRQIQKIA